MPWPVDCTIAMTSHGRHSAFNHRQLDCLFNRLFRLANQRCPLLAFYEGKPPVTSLNHRQYDCLWKSLFRQTTFKPGSQFQEAPDLEPIGFFIISVLRYITSSATKDEMSSTWRHYRFSAESRFYTLQWRHNEHDGVSNHRRLDCLTNRKCIGADQRNYQSSALLASVKRIHRWPMDSHKRPVTQKMFPYHHEHRVVVKICVEFRSRVLAWGTRR